MNTAVPHLLASIVELPGAESRARDGLEPEYLQRAKALLAEESGFSNAGRFTAAYRSRIGVVPAEDQTS